ncbi:hypothetical protein [Paraburkholderia kururiensis]|uniref:hypothetical protein n=1 Tax=Paraburkholderia kururiensis TaxID=984307 RepID=UPI0018F48E95
MLHPFRAALSAMSRQVRHAAVMALGVVVGVTALAVPGGARAEGQLRIAEQFGVVYLLLNVARDRPDARKSDARRTGLPDCCPC